ncbi:MAG TPA: hypothetical protein VNM24_07000 [Burkholderiales bacterium]|nr:hypothetical protein [Burkholderiales bacterium]
MSEAQRPDYRTLLEHLGAAPFVLGGRDGRWRLLRVAWPFADIAIAAALREGSPSEYAMRFECTGYPSGVTGRLWDMEEDAPLRVARWPGGKSRVPAVFRADWKGGSCLYLPCDRVTIEGHENWRTQHRSMCWSRSRGIVSYLEVVSELLTSKDYTGVRGA